MRKSHHTASALIIALSLTAMTFFGGQDASAAAMPRTDIVITGDRVYLGDLFTGLPEGQASVPIARSPAPGREVVLDQRWVVRLVHAHGVALDSSVTSLPRMTVSRQSVAVTGDVIVDALRMALLQADATVMGDRLEVSMDRMPDTVHLPDDSQMAGGVADVDILDLTLDRSSGRFSARAIVGSQGDGQVTVPISGRARSMISVPVLSRRISNNAVIANEDLSWVDVDAMRVDSAVVHDPSEIVGMTLRRGVVPNTPIRSHDLTPPVIVSRGDRVTMVVSNGSLSLTAQGRALENGARGQTIRVMNVDSNQTVDGVVENNGSIRVLGGAGAS